MKNIVNNLSNFYQKMFEDWKKSIENEVALRDKKKAYRTLYDVYYATLFITGLAIYFLFD